MRTLSLVIPVYNAPELARNVCAAVSDLVRVAEASGFRLVEVLFIDDGSTPALDLSSSAVRPPPVSVLRNEVNRGKGFSVRRGALAAKGDWVLMSDVDMSAPFTEFARLASHAEAWMVCGSRYGRPGVPLRRRLLSCLFRLCVHLFGVKGVHDTQCGFKLFRMDRMRPVFEMQRIDRFAFDVELIRSVRRLDGSVAEVPVEWKGGASSSLRILRDAPRMLLDLFRI